MLTALHTYRYSIDKPAENKAYKALVEKLTVSHGECFRVLASSKAYQCIPGLVELCVRNLYSNQWNTTATSPNNPDRRVFDWYEGVLPNPSIKAGHWLEITTEMRTVREEISVCGFCGNCTPTAAGLTFCQKCLSSKYLNESELYLLRLKPIALRHPERKPLSKAEMAILEPIYAVAQRARRAEEADKARAAAIANAEAAINAALTERDGKIWLCEHDTDIPLTNVIYYAHNNMWCFGWRTPLSATVATNAREVLAAFPFPYEICC